MLCLAVLAVAFCAALVWLLYSGLKARHELQVAQAQVHTLRTDVAAGDLAGARAAAASLRSHADAAHRLTTGPVWALAASVPYLGDPFDTTRAVTTSVHDVADQTLPALIEATRTLSPDHLRRSDGTFDVQAIGAARAPLERAAHAMDSALSAIQASSGHTWLGSVNSARGDLITELSALSGSVHSAVTAAAVLPPMLGADGLRTYMVTFENEAELRGLGGLPGAFAILKADNGKLSFTRFESDVALSNAVAHVDLGHEFDVLWPGGPTSLYVNSDESAHFPYAARIWTSMWQQKSGQQLDGAIALDPTTLSYLLRVTGPATMRDGTVVSADNVVALTESEIYRRFATDNNARKRYLLELARAVSAKLVSASADLAGLLRSAGQATSEHRLLVWARDPGVEARLAPAPLSGAIPSTATPYAGLAVVNTLGSKLDYYLHTAVDWKRSGCGQFRDVTVTMRFTNAAPSHGLPKYVLGFTGRPGFPKQPGTSRLAAYYYASLDAVVKSATLDGAPLATSLGYERGHPVVGVSLTVPPGASQVVALHLVEPADTGSVTARMQPMVNPVQFSHEDATCPS